MTGTIASVFTITIQTETEVEIRTVWHPLSSIRVRLDDPMNTVGWLELLTEERDVRVREDGSIERILAFPGREGCMSAIGRESIR
jgi:hypothetical protein